MAGLKTANPVVDWGDPELDEPDFPGVVDPILDVGLVLVAVLAPSVPQARNADRVAHFFASDERVIDRERRNRVCQAVVGGPEFAKSAGLDNSLDVVAAASLDAADIGNFHKQAQLFLIEQVHAALDLLETEQLILSSIASRDENPAVKIVIKLEG
jgi:hypothetical protein